MSIDVDFIGSLVTKEFKFCTHCGARALLIRRGDDRCDRFVCSDCGETTLLQPHKSPALMVLTYVLARDRMLLIKRGSAPYIGQWAPPGGFVDWGESLERAAVREIWEETRVTVECEQLLPFAVASIPTINQVYYMFAACLDEVRPATCVPPESAAAAWFTEPELQSITMWEPVSTVDTHTLFAGAVTGHFDFHQQSDDFTRVVIRRQEVTYRTCKCPRWPPT